MPNPKEEEIREIWKAILNVFEDTVSEGTISGDADGYSYDYAYPTEFACDFEVTQEDELHMSLNFDEYEIPTLGDFRIIYAEIEALTPNVFSDTSVLITLIGDLFIGTPYAHGAIWYENFELTLNGTVESGRIATATATIPELNPTWDTSAWGLADIFIDNLNLMLDLKDTVVP